MVFPADARVAEVVFATAAGPVQAKLGKLSSGATLLISGRTSGRRRGFRFRYGRAVADNGASIRSELRLSRR